MFTKLYGVIPMKTAREIMKKDVICASPDEPIKNIIAKMDNHGIKEMPVVENKKIVGMITYYDILDFVRADPNEKASSLMIKPPVIAPEASVEEVIDLMLHSGVEAIPVVENEIMAGLISDYDVLMHLLDDAKIKKLKVRDVMNEDTKLLKANDPVSEARRIMRYHKWHKLPIVDAKGKLMGMITSLDILTAFYKQPKERIGNTDSAANKTNPLMLPVSNFMKKNVPELDMEDNISEVLKKLLNSKLKGAPIVDKSKKVIGMFERWAVLDKLIEKKYRDGVWLNFSGFPLSIETIDLVKDYLSADIKKMKRLCPELESIDTHIKKLHGATPEKWNYEIKVKLNKSSGKAEIVSGKESWYGYNLMFTIKDAFNRLMSQLEKKSTKQKNKNSILEKRSKSIKKQR